MVPDETNNENESPPDEAAELYALPLDEFTSARNDLARSLSETGDKEAAAAVRKLKKPGLAAWSINQLARSNAEELGELLAVTDRMKKADNAADVRETIAERHKRIRQLVDKARTILEDAGHSAGAGTIHQVTQTLYAAHSDREREQIARGTLERPIESSGFDTSQGLSLEAEVTEDTPDKETRARQELEAEVAEAEEQAADLQRKAESARLAAEHADDAAANAHRKVMRLRSKLEQLGR
jgi:hypothetical protein